MINSGPRRFKYRAGLNHTGDDDRVGHCQSCLAFCMPQSSAFVVGQKNSFDHDLKTGFPAVPVAELLEL